MENINSDLLKLTCFLENKDLDSSDSEGSIDNDDSENVIRENQPSTSRWDPTESIVDDEDTVYVLKSCKNPLLKNALISNVKKRKILNELARTLEHNIAKLRNMQQEYMENVMKQQHLVKYAMRKRLGAPYFKQSNWFHSPHNEDYVQICKQKQLLLADTSFLRYLWTVPNKNTLLMHIFDDIFYKKLEEVRKSINLLKGSKTKKNRNLLASLINDEQIFSDREICGFLIKNWNKILVTPSEIKVKNVFLQEDDPKYRVIRTINDWNTEHIDWTTAVHQLKFRYSKQCCRQMWCCYLHPRYSKSPWKDHDNMRLMKIAKRFKMQNWEAIANTLKIFKSPYQCCVHFFSNVYDKFSREKWTEEEDKLLLELVESSKIGNFISWSNIACHFKGRPVQNLYTHYYRTLNPLYTKGAFTIEEDVILLAALQIFNEDMKIAHSHLPFRTLQQLRERYRTMSTNDTRDFTIEDDCKIVSHVNIHGDKNWNDLCKEIDRSTSCIRHRSITLKKWFTQNPDTNLECVPRRSKGYLRNRVRTRCIVVSLAVRKILALVESDAYDISTVLNVTFIHKKILTPMKEYQDMMRPKKKKRIIIPKKKQNDDQTLYQYFMNIFASSARSVHPFELDETDSEEIENKAIRIQSILKLLGANLEIPSVEEIDNNNYLDVTDRLILKQIMDKPSTSTQRPLSKFLPATVESLTGLRSLMLHCPLLRQHSKGEYKGYNYYVYMENRFEAHGRLHSMRKRFDFMTRLDSDEKKIVLHQQTIFFQRLKIIFFWPSIFHNTLIEPIELPSSTTVKLEIPPEQETPVEKKKGRPPKPVVNQKIIMMNLAKKAKKQRDLKKAQCEMLQVVDNSQESDTAETIVVEEIVESQELSEKIEENVNNEAIKKLNMAVEREITVKNIDNRTVAIFTDKRLTKRKARGNRGRKRKIKNENEENASDKQLPENSKVAIKKHKMNTENALIQNSSNNETDEVKLTLMSSVIEETMKTDTAPIPNSSNEEREEAIKPIQNCSNIETTETSKITPRSSNRKRKCNPAYHSKNIFPEENMQFERDIISELPQIAEHETTAVKSKRGRPKQVVNENIKKQKM